MELHGKIAVFGALESPRCLEQINRCAEQAEQSALMADHHVGYSMPIGGVAGYKQYVSPSGVGYDIACGNKAVRLDVDSNHVKTNIVKIMDEIARTISFGVGRKNNEEVEHDLFSDPTFDEISVCNQLKTKARQQLGTVGSGNHYVDVFVDEQDQIWIGVHFGSRGFGHGIATHFLTAAGAKDGMDEPPCLLHEQSDLGEQYIKAMSLAGRYAYAGRDWVCSKVASIIGGSIVEEIHNHHNFAWREEHKGEMLWVVRKGATPAFPGQKGFVGGSMGDNSVILEGVDHPDNQLSLCSTVHGAGRVMGRREAAGKTKWVFDAAAGRKVQKVIRGGKVTRQMMNDWIKERGVVLRGAGTDESPHCYKRLDQVLGHHNNTVRILHTLKPLGVVMAGADEFDPYKD